MEFLIFLNGKLLVLPLPDKVLTFSGMEMGEGAGMQQAIFK